MTTLERALEIGPLLQERVLLALQQEKIPPDVLKLLTQGNPLLGVKPGVLARALAAMLQELTAIVKAN